MAEEKYMSRHTGEEIDAAVDALVIKADKNGDASEDFAAQELDAAIISVNGIDVEQAIAALRAKDTELASDIADDGVEIGKLRTAVSTKAEAADVTAAIKNATAHPLADIFKACGATLDTATGLWKVSGLSLTDEEMAHVAAAGGLGHYQTKYKYYNTNGLLTNYAYTLTDISTDDITAMFRNCSSVVVARVCGRGSTLTITESTRGIAGFSSAESAFANCSRLTHVMGRVNMEACTQTGSMFAGCASLVQVWLYHLKTSVSLADSPSVSFESLRYLVDNAANGSSPITVNVHADVRLMLNRVNSIDDAERVSELYAKSGHTRDEWTALDQAAEAALITFAGA